nr:immunoglobulin light chain junction region [Macaca mulatta]
CLLYFIGTRVF